MNLALAHQHRSISRFESRLESLGRWDCGSNPRFLQRRPRQSWRRRSLDSQFNRSTQKRKESWIRQSVDIGLFATYFLVFLASLWMLG